MAESAHVMGVDIGTTGCRACAVSADGLLLAEASVPYEPDRPRPGWAEQDPQVWWDAFCKATCEIAARGDLKAVRAVAFSTQSTALIPLDGGGEPLRKAIIWQDRRCAPQCRQIARRFGERKVREVIGWKPDTFHSWPKILWFMEEEPHLFARTRWLVQVGGYLALRLCGKLVLDRANAVGYPMNVGDLTWHEEFCSWRDFPREKISPIVDSVSVIGEVSSEATGQCGVPPGTPIVAGGMDTACAAFAVGVDRPGRSFEVSGTSGGIGVCSQAPSAEEKLGVAPHLFENVYINHAPMSAAGASLKWFKDQFCGDLKLQADRQGRSAYEVMEEGAASLPDGPTGLLFLPYLAGERAPVWDPDARGVMVGFSLDTTRAQMIKMVMEGVAYALRQNAELAEAAGLHVAALRSCGGGARSRLWSQIKADVTGLPVVVYPPHRDAAFGAALLAGVGTGLWTREEADALLEAEQTTVYEPRPHLTSSYEPFYRRYCRLYDRFRDVWAAPGP